MPVSILPDIKFTQEQQMLTKDERNTLIRIRNKRVLFILSAYFGLAYVLVEAWTRVFRDEPYWGLLELFKFRFFLSQFELLLFLLLTIYFINYYLKAVHPFVKDVNTGKKDIIVFTPERYKTPFFPDYYLETPLKKRSLIKINQELYDAVSADVTACMHLSSYAKYVLMVEVAGRKMKFNGSNALVDM